MPPELRLGLLVAFVTVMAAVQLPSPANVIAAAVAAVAGIGFILWGRAQRRARGHLPPDDGAA